MSPRNEYEGEASEMGTPKWREGEVEWTYECPWRPMQGMMYRARHRLGSLGYGQDGHGHGCTWLDPT